MQKNFLIFIIIPVIFLGACTNPSVLKEVQNGLIKGNITLNNNEYIKLSNTIKETDTSNIPFLNSIFKTNKKTATDTYLLKFKNSTDINLIKKELNNKGICFLESITSSTYKIKIENKSSKILDYLKNHPDVLHIEPDYHTQILNIPTDYYYPEQWNLKLLGLEKTWDYYQGNADTIIAVLDTGILTEHPDLKNKIVQGYDFIDNDNIPYDTTSEFSHGTHVAGIIAAVSNNGSGITAINWHSRIMPIRVMGPEGMGNISTLISGIRWAVDHGANIINLSLASSGSSILLKEALQYALEHNVTVIAAAGNENTNHISYPARYQETISVGAIGPSRERAFYSNYGPELDLVAPGGNSENFSMVYPYILSTSGPEKDYSWQQGTSMAAPHISGIVSLLYSTGITEPENIKKLLKETADDLGTPGEDDEYGAGLVNINRALNIDISEEIKNDEIKNDSNKKANYLSSINVYAQNNNGNFTPSIKTDAEGFYSLSLKPGNWKIIAWLDTNKNQKIDIGDYYNHYNGIELNKNQIIKDINIDLKLVD